MRFFKLSLVVLVLFTACKKETTVTKSEEDLGVLDSLKITKEDISKINYQDIALDVKSNPIVSNWQAYLDVSNGIQALTLPDFTFFNADVDLFNSNLTDLEETIPESINTQAIKARVLVLKTMMLKFQEIESLDTSTKTELLLAIKQVFLAQSNLNLQINKKVEKDSQVIVKPY